MTDAIASRLRQFRKAQGLSLRALSASSGVSQAMLSEIERGSKNPTVKLAYQVAQALGVSISALVEEPAASVAMDGAVIQQRPAVTGLAESPSSVLLDPQSGIRREGFANPLLHGRLEVVLYTLPPASRSGQMAPNQAGVLETIVVLDGQLDLHLGDRIEQLVAGQTASHGVAITEYCNPSTGQECRFLLLVDTSRC